MSEHSALVPVFEGRPPFIYVNGVVVCLSQHDATYFARRRDWMKKLRAHPDTGGTDNKFMKVHRAFKRWELREEKWYRLHGVNPPGSLTRISPAVGPRPRKLKTDRSVEAQDRSRDVFKRENARNVDRKRTWVAGGLCRQCGKPRGENGTKTMCRSCADSKTTPRLYWEREQARRYRHNEDLGKKENITICASQGEIVAWKDLAEKKRISVSRLVRVAVRQMYEYSLRKVAV